MQTSVNFAILCRLSENVSLNLLYSRDIYEFANENILGGFVSDVETYWFDHHANNLDSNAPLISLVKLQILSSGYIAFN